MNTNPLLLIDFYKATHHEQYPKGLTRMVSYYTPRMSRLVDVDKVTFFGLQGFIQEYLIDMFNEHFFNKKRETVVAEYLRVLNATLGKGTYDHQKIISLYNLGYLPLRIRAVPEGMRTAIGVPQIEISNTHPDFVWLVNTIETMLSCTMWHTQVSAEVGYRYRQIVDKYRDLTCDDSVRSASLLGDFSMRGQHSVESATKSSAAWLLSFRNTATVPAILWLEDHYYCDCEKDEVGYGAISTEHSVMCSNYAVDGDEITQIRRLLTEIYPHNNFSMVSDSYDYWNLVDNILPQLKDEILAHDGCISIRGDSGDPVEVIAGYPLIAIDHNNRQDYEDAIDNENDLYCIADFVSDYINNNYEGPVIIQDGDTYDKVWFRCEWDDDGPYLVWENTERNIIPTSKDMGTVWALWKEFGGTINSKGYKILNPHIKAIYGDSITPQRCEEIYRRLIAKGFAINNVTLGVGSFSMMCLEDLSSEYPNYSPYTRDTFGIAVKATYAEDKDGKPIPIFKQPKDCNWKKSQKGCCIVASDGQSYSDGHEYGDTINGSNNLLQTVFIDGDMVKIHTLKEVRENLYGGNF